MKISEELLTAYLEGNTTKEETLKVLNALATDPELREIMEIALKVDDQFHDMSPFELEDDSTQIVSLNRDILPMMQLAATDDENLCSVICEIYILHRHHIDFDKDDLLATARRHRWLKAEGTPLHAIGQLLILKGLLVTRKYDATLDDLVHVLDLKNDVIVAGDIQKLYSEHPVIEAVTSHAVVVANIDLKTGIVTIFDPEKRAVADIPVANFQRAWKDSQNYMVRVLKSIDEYEPEPIQLDDVTLSENFIELREAIAENLHDVWSEARIKEGWTYGPKRDDEKKQHPDLIPYCALADSEKEYDRLMAWNTIKLVKKLGYLD